MKLSPAIRTILSAFVLTVASVGSVDGTGAENPPSDRYLAVVRQFADHVIARGKDVYGPKHTPLFVDGLNVETGQPPEWKKDGETWVLSNLASQQNLFRVFDGLTRLTGDAKYRQAAADAIAYAFENLRGPNGLLLWGGHIAYDARGDKIVMEQYNHELKSHYPYYPLMWEVNPQATKRFLEAFWAAHILDWSNLEMNRHGSPKKPFTNPWANEYKGGPVFFWGTGLSFLNTGSDLYYAGALLSKLSGEKEPLVWAKRMAHRYVETRNPKVGISGFQFSQSRTATCYENIRGDRAQYQYGDDFPGHFVVEGTLFPCYGDTPAVRPWMCMFLLGEMLGKDGAEFTQWALEEFTAWGKAAYRASDNSFIPMLTDGTSMEGYVCKKDGYFGPKGRVLKAGRAGAADFWGYALAFRITRDPFMWQMLRSIAKGNRWGELPAEPSSAPAGLNTGGSASAELLLALLDLHSATKQPAYLAAARQVGDAIVAQKFQKGFFVQSPKHIMAKFDAVEPLALLHLYAVEKGVRDRVPTVWPGNSFFHCPFDGAGRTYDNSVIYNKVKN